MRDVKDISLFFQVSINTSAMLIDTARVQMEGDPDKRAEEKTSGYLGEKKKISPRKINDKMSVHKLGNFIKAATAKHGDFYFYT